MHKVKSSRKVWTSTTCPRNRTYLYNLLLQAYLLKWTILGQRGILEAMALKLDQDEVNWDIGLLMECSSPKVKLMYFSNRSNGCLLNTINCVNYLAPCNLLALFFNLLYPEDGNSARFWNLGNKYQTLDGLETREHLIHINILTLKM